MALLRTNQRLFSPFAGDREKTGRNEVLYFNHNYHTRDVVAYPIDLAAHMRVMGQ